MDERSDPEKATVAAAKYLKTLSRMFNGDWNLVLAAYNGGPGRVQRAMKRAGEEDFWALSQTPKYLPKETREYVPLILAAMIVAKNPAQYGFDIIAHEPISYDKVTVPRAIDLRRVAEWTGVGIDEIQALNPELRRWTTPVKYADFQLKVPTGTGAKFEARSRRGLPVRHDGTQVVHRQRRGVAGVDFTQAEGEPHRPGRSQRTRGHVARPRPGRN